MKANQQQDYLKISQQKVKQSVQRVKKKITKELKQRKYLNSNSYVLQNIKNQLRSLIRSEFGWDINIEISPANISSDLTITTFNIAKQIKGDPLIIAQQIAKLLENQNLTIISKIKIAGPYVNIDLDKTHFYQKVLKQTATLDSKYGESDLNAKQIALFDYSSPNIAKPIGVGHLRSTIIGQSLINIYKATGYTTIGDNHLGDWGTQFGELIYAYKHWGNKQRIKQNPIKELNHLYVRFHREAKTKPEIIDEARLLFQKLEQHDPAITKLWKDFRDISVKSFTKTYKLLGINFDLWIGESYFANKVDEIIQDCLEKNICKKDKSTPLIVVDSLENLPSFILQKQDGSSIYMARDLAALKYRIKTFHPQTIIYVVGGEQKLYFQQLFALAKKLGYLPQEVTAQHVDFGLVLINGKKMSTRSGSIIELNDLINKAVQKAKKLLLSKNRKMAKQELDKIAETIGIGAIIYNDLRQSRINNITFDWNKMLNLEGGSSVYLQYTYVRIQSIIKKFQHKPTTLSTPTKLVIKYDSPLEFELAKKIACFSEIIIKAQKENEPCFIAVYLEDLARVFNKFYDSVSIIKTKDKSLQQSRLLLIKAIGIVIKKGLNILNIKIPERM